MVTTKTPEGKRNNSSGAQRSAFSPSASSRLGHVRRLQETIGNQSVQRLFKSGVIRAKLKIGQPNDIHEQEAGGVADQVLRMPEPALQPKPA